MMQTVISILLVLVIVQSTWCDESTQLYRTSLKRREINKFSRRNTLALTDVTESVQPTNRNIDVSKALLKAPEETISSSIASEEDIEDIKPTPIIIRTTKQYALPDRFRRQRHKEAKKTPSEDILNPAETATVEAEELYNSENEKAATTTSSVTATTKKPYNPRERIVNRFSRKGKYEDQGQLDTRGKLQPNVVRIIDMNNYVFSHRGNFHYNFESADGTKAFERGELKYLDDNSKGPSVRGGYSYKDKDGKDIVVQYEADENGFRPIGDHLPTPPPIPPEIARALFHLATKAPDYNDYN